MKVGKNIRHVRVAKGYSQEYMASKLGMSQNNFSKIEKGEVNLSVDRLSEIAKLLEVEPTELLISPEIYFHHVSSNNQKGGYFNNVVINDPERQFDKERVLFNSLLAAKEEIIKIKDQQIPPLKVVLKEIRPAV